MTPARVPALALLLLASCATAPEMKRSPLAPSKSTAQGAPEPKPPDQPSPKSAIQPAVLKDPGKPNVKPAQYEDTLSAHCRQVPLPANCVPPPSGEEVVFEVLKPPPSHTPIPWYRWLWPFGLAAAKDSDPEEAARRYDKPPKPNEVNIADKDWQAPEPNAPRYLPCFYAGQGGPGPFRPEKAPPDWIRCAYRCGRYEVILYDVRFPRPDPDKNKKEKPDVDEICRKWIKRAEDHARSYDGGLRAKGE